MIFTWVFVPPVNEIASASSVETEIVDFVGGPCKNSTQLPTSKHTVILVAEIDTFYTFILPLPVYAK